MIIRQAQQSDLKVMTDIYNQAIIRKECTADTETFTVSQRQAWFDAHKDPAYPLYACEIDGRVVGYVYLSGYRPGRKAMRYITEVSYYIDNDYQGQGIGSKLLPFAIEKAKALGYRDMVAILLSLNTPSIKLLEKFGFEKWGDLPNVADFDGVLCSHLYYGLKL
ncbi:GNAT family N-acetyltransferase [Fusibacter sp. JL216-2]|uniref:GNAT family N-acetyltransferase n=1 Tax=Fusibacter sp. JL216-2 TaxID=3071453 RepID=UPI003D32CCE6